jgi:CxxC motif-containing protein (DUF1111 family)
LRTTKVVSAGSGLSNRFSSAGCHIGNGRGETSTGETRRDAQHPGAAERSGRAGERRADSEPAYGDQLQPTGISGVQGEGQASIRWLEREETRRWHAVSLRKPERLSLLHYGPIARDTMTSVRMSPGVFGLGLLAAVPDEELRVLADPEDKNRDGVRGRVNHVWNTETGRREVGRFRLKANQPTLRQQVAAALIGDMGITSTFIENCTASEEACTRFLRPRPEIADDDLATLVSYVEAIAPPVQRCGRRVSRQGGSCSLRSAAHPVTCRA